MKSRTKILYIDPETKPYYDDIRRIYKRLKLSNSDLFSLALAFGRYYDIKKPLDRKVGYIRLENVSKNLLALIDLLFINEFEDYNQEFFENPIFGFDLAEEYANAGIKILIEKIHDSNEDFESFLFKKMLNLYNNVDFEKLE